RTEAGQLLALELMVYANRPDVIILGLPRGGVPVAFQVAQALKVPLDICLVRKLGVPGQPELAMGAIAMGGVMVINDEIVASMSISRQVMAQVAAQEQHELERRDRLYRGDRPLPNVRHRTVILIDDGIATGSTLRAAIATLQKQQPEQIVIAIPVAPLSTCAVLKTEVDQLICLNMPQPLYSISYWYKDFTQTSDDEVRRLLQSAPPTPIIASRSL
ncbi:MAG: phosphoribosyltransferase, partial [Cyanothece sp. SIO1E1]|nr:phosphoribosyltransferase [Cyanothece sp. SIO1E1]